MLLERDSQLAAVGAALRTSSRGDGQLIIVDGPPGAGISCLLPEIVRRAEALGFCYLSAVAAEPERRLRSDLLRQLLAASRAFGDDRPAVSSVPAAPAGPSAPGGMGLYERAQEHFRSLARQRPLLLVVDDAQWADPTSLAALLYLNRRLTGTPICLLLAVHPSATTAPALLELLRRADLRATLPPLSPAAIERLAIRAFGVPPGRGFLRTCAELTGGNPLLVTELLAEGHRRELVPTDESIGQLTGLTPPVLIEVVRDRLRRLGPKADALGGSVAVLAGHAWLPVAAAVAGLAVQEAELVLDGLAVAGLLRVEHPLRFVHPLLHAAVYQGMADGLRSQRHRQAARLLADAGISDEEVATHLLPTLPTADDWVRRRLHAAGRRALDAGSPQQALPFLRRALAEDPLTVEADVLLHLGHAEALVNEPAAQSHLQAAFERAGESALRSQAAVRLARLLACRGRQGEAERVLHAALAQAEEDPAGPDAELSLRLRAEGLWLLLSAGQTESEYIEQANQLGAGLPGHTHGQRLALTHLGVVRVFQGAPSEQVQALAERALGAGRLLDEEGPDSPMWLCTAALLWVAGRYGDAELELHRGEVRASELAAAGALAQIWTVRAWIRFELGDLAGAESLARQALDHIREGGWTGERSSRACLATVLTERGAGDDAAHLLAAQQFRADQMDPFDALLLHARAELRLFRQDPRGVDDLLTVGSWCDARSIHNPGAWAWRTDVAAGLTERGEAARAKALMAEEVDRASRFGAPRPLGRALHVAALVGPARDRLAGLEAAVDVLDASPAALAAARAHLHLGAARQRARMPQQAQSALRLALELADSCGATPIVNAALQLLHDLGARPRRRALSGPGSLTPGEREVALRAAVGLTNQQIATQLYISVKAVEKHLHNSYHKLGVPSRAGLAGAMQPESIHLGLVGSVQLPLSRRSAERP